MTHSLHIAWTPDGNRQVLECTCGAQMAEEVALRHLREHGLLRYEP